MCLSLSLLPLLGGGVYLSPYPLPWTWTGGAASHQTVLFLSRWLQEGVRCSRMAPKMPQYSTRSLKMTSIMPPRGTKRATRRFQVLLDTPQDLPEKPKSFKNQKKITDFCLLAFSLPMRF